jgi:heme o synthase
MEVRYTDAKTSVEPAWRDYLDLTKPGKVLMMLLSAVVVMFIAADGFPALATFTYAVIGLYLALSGSSALNSYLEADIDALVNTTRQRPLPMRKMHPYHALTFGVSMVTVSFMLLLSGVNWLAAFLMVAGVVLHIIVYTRWLKRRSVYSTFAAGTAGAFPVLIGWASITGSLSIDALVFFAIIFYWATPHLWSLALLHRNEYLRAALPLLPVLQGPQAARIQIGRYTVLMVFMTLLPVGMGLLDRYYAFAALTLGGMMIILSIQLYLSPSSQTNLRFYKNSMLYLALLLAAMLADKTIF